MLDALRFVQGSVDKKGIVEELLHYRIEGGFVRGYNGRISLRSPIDTDLVITPKGVPFMKAIAGSTETIALSVTNGGKVSVRSGKFRALVQQTTNPFPDLPPEGEYTSLAGAEFMQTLSTLLPYTAEDASRPWSNGVLFVGDKAYATNNVVLVQAATGVVFPNVVNIPKQTLREMLRLRVVPVGVQVADRTITFHYEGDRWLRSNLLECSAWPDAASLLAAQDWGALEPVPADLYTTLETLLPFVNDLGQVHFANGVASTESGPDTGAIVECGYDFDGVYNLPQLLGLQGVAETADFSQYPKPCPFECSDARGVIIGMRV